MPWTATCQASLSFTISLRLLKFTSIELVMASTISSSVTPFSCPQSFPASGSFPMSRLFISRGQSRGTSASTWVFLINIQSWFPLELTSLISLLSKGFSRVFSSTTERKTICVGFLSTSRHFESGFRCIKNSPSFSPISP